MLASERCGSPGGKATDLAIADQTTKTRLANPEVFGRLAQGIDFLQLHVSTIAECGHADQIPFGQVPARLGNWVCARNERGGRRRLAHNLPTIGATEVRFHHQDSPE
jgi:hypothetical protein